MRSFSSTSARPQKPISRKRRKRLPSSRLSSLTMKSVCPRVLKSKPAFAACLTAFFVVSSFFIPKVQASSEMDRQYSLDSVGILRPWDNIDGLFAEYLRESYKEY